MMLAGEQILRRISLQNHMASPAKPALAAARVERIPGGFQNIRKRPLQPVCLQAAQAAAGLDLDGSGIFHNQANARAMAARWAGVVPQHPPMIEIPASRRRSAAAAISSGEAS